MARNTWLAVAILLCASLPARSEPLVFETQSLRLAIAEDGTVQSLVSLPDSKEYVREDARIPFATVYRGGRSVPSSQKKYGEVTERWIYQGGQTSPATNAVRQGDELRVKFAGARTTAVYRVTARPDYLAFELQTMEGEPVDRIDWLCLNLVDLPNRGAWVNLAFGEQFGVCLCAGNVRTNVEMDQTSDDVTLRAVAEREVGLEGAVAVLFGCRDPRNRFLDVMSVAERDFGMPAGADNRRRPGQRLSYLWASRPTPENIDEYIRLAKRGGFRVILFSYTSFSTGAGHFKWNAAYPNGMADLKRVTEAIRQAGLKVGLHIHYSKASKTDAYVTPVPDARLHLVREFTLAEAIDAATGTISVHENPAGCTLDDGRRILKIGEELVAYENYRSEPPYDFTGCVRGHLGTSATGHAKAERLGLLDVDTWPSFVRFDQNTDIQQEVSQRIGEIYRQTGPYEMVYFDGAEDVHAPFWYHVASAQQRVFRQFEPPPPVCESALYTHFSWHMITRGNAYDIVAPAEGMKDFCRLMPCPTAAERTKDFSRIDFGWLGRLEDRDASPDVWEYVISRAAAWDCPISLKAEPSRLASNPRWEDCLDAIRTWEDARLENHLSDTQREMLRNVRPEDAHYVPCYDQRGIWENIRANRGLTPVQQRILADRREHHLFANEQGEYELVPITEVPLGRTAVKAYTFQRASRPKDTYVLIWAVDGEVELQLPVADNSLSAMRPFGTEIPLRRTAGKTVVTISGRSYLVFAGLAVEETTRILSESARTRDAENVGSPK